METESRSWVGNVRSEDRRRLLGWWKYSILDSGGRHGHIYFSELLKYTSKLENCILWNLHLSEVYLKYKTNGSLSTLL